MYWLLETQQNNQKRPLSNPSSIRPLGDTKEDLNIYKDQPLKCLLPSSHSTREQMENNLLDPL